MKKIKYIVILICLFSVSSCDDFLDKNPIDAIGEGDFYKTTEEINQAVLACYNGLQSTIKQEWLLTEMRSDNTRHEGKTSMTGTSKELYEFDKLLVLTGNMGNNTYWEATYHNIANCNTVLKHIDVVSDPALKEQYRAEALLIRAYHYFNLVRLYGPVFIIENRLTADEALFLERSPEEEVYELIIGDLKDIIEKNSLPEKYNDSNIGRVDIWVAKGLLAKMYLTLKQYDDAKPLLNDILRYSHYDLEKTSYANVFSVQNEMNEEIMFTIRFKSGGLGLGSPFGNWFAPTNSGTAIIEGDGNGYNCPTEDLVNAYNSESGDTRKDAVLAYTWANGQNVVTYKSHIRKYLSPVATKEDGDSDWPILRYADILLMMGEVENEINGVSAGLPYLNQTRVRAGLTELTEADIQDKDVFRLAMEKERRLEFAFENQRFFDLLRTDRLVEVMKNHYETELFRNTSTGEPSLFYPGDNISSVNDPILKEWQKLLPIPLNTLTVAPNATQNPGY